MATTAELQAELTTLEAEMAQPQSVTFADRSVTRRPFDQLQARRTQILSELARQNGRHRQFFAVSSKGLS